MSTSSIATASTPTPPIGVHDLRLEATQPLVHSYIRERLRARERRRTPAELHDLRRGHELSALREQ